MARLTSVAGAGPVLRISHRRGVVLAAAGALCLVPDATLVRLVDAGDLPTTFWRALFVGCMLLGVTGLRYRGGTRRAYRTIGRSGLLVSGAMTVGLVGFVYSVNHTAVANTLVILATSPFFAALFTRLLIGEPVPVRTWVAMALAAGGVAVTFGSSVEAGGTSGNLVAIAVAAAMGFNLTMVRRAGPVDMAPAYSLGGFAGAAVLLPSAWPVGVSARDLLLLGAMGLVLASAFTLLALGTRYIPSPEAVLLLMLETVLGPMLAWLVVGEAPPRLAAVGGAVVLLTLAGNAWAGLRANGPARRPVVS